MAINDPIQGLIDFVTEVKPFHTKILEAVVSYAQNENVDVTFTEDLNLDVAIFWPANVGSPETEGPIRVCAAGYGVEFDRSTPYIIVNANISPQTISLEGNYETAFAVGSNIEIREPYQENTFGSPLGSPQSNTPRVAIARVTSVSYDTDTNTTILGLIILSEDWLGSPVYWVGSPSVRPINVTSFTGYTTATHLTGNHDASSQWLVKTGGDINGSPALADTVAMVSPLNTLSSVNSNIDIAPFLPVLTNSNGSPAITDRATGKNYVEFKIEDLYVSDRPVFGFVRLDHFRYDRTITLTQTNTVGYDGGTGLVGTGAGSTIASGTTLSLNDIVQIAVDWDAQKLWFGVNNTWLGSPADPETGAGGYWPTSFTATNYVGAGNNSNTANPHLGLVITGSAADTGFFTGSPDTPVDGGSPFGRLGSSTGDFISIRESSQFWTYTPPTGFEKWHANEYVSEPNVAGENDYQWLWKAVPFNDPWTSTRGYASTYGPVAWHSQIGTTSNIYYSLKRRFGDGGKYYAEVTITSDAGGGDIGLIPASVLGSPLTSGIGSPYFQDLSSTVGSVAIDFNSNFWIDGALVPGSGEYGDTGLWVTGNPTDDGRTSDSYDDGDTLMFAFDFDRDLVWIGVNGVWSLGFDPSTTGSPSGGTRMSSTTLGSPQDAEYVFGAQNSGFGKIVNLGGIRFNYTPPTGFEAWATIPSSDFFGSPFTIPNGSPPFGGNEFWFPPYGGNQSGGDVFAIYDVVSTNTLNIITRPSPYYGSPITAVGSPFKSIWPDSAGSPLPGSPKIVSGSPATYPNFGSPEPSSGNTIVIKSTTPDIFLYGQEVEIRNATDSDINRAYNIYRARDLGGSPNLVELTVLDTVLADTTNDGELLFTPDGFSGGDICGDVPPELLQVHWLEDLNFDWRFADGSPQQVMSTAFQHFILEANATANTVVVQGDTRYIGEEFGSPVGGSPINVPAIIQHARSNYGSPFWVGSPYVDLNTNNGAVVISNITYDASTNRSTLQLDSISTNDPSGWIISV